MKSLGEVRLDQRRHRPHGPAISAAGCATPFAATTTADGRPPRLTSPSPRSPRLTPSRSPGASPVAAVQGGCNKLFTDWNKMHTDTDTSDVEVAANMSTVEGDLYAVGLPKNAKAFATIVTVPQAASRRARAPTLR